MIHALFIAIKVHVVEERLNIDFISLCDWFEDNKLSIHLGVDKTKFCSLREERRKIYISIGDTTIIPHAKISYLGCLLVMKTCQVSLWPTKF